MNVFVAVKGAVTTREAGELYGISVRQNGMAVCPFHDDRTPSMKVDERFHCFSCGADGDVIDFTSRLYNLSPREAAEKLAQDFSINYEGLASTNSRPIRKKSGAQIKLEQEQRSRHALTDYLHQLKRWKTEHAPTAPEEVWNEHYVEAVQEMDYIEYLLDTLISGSPEEKTALIADCENKIKSIEQRGNFSMSEKMSNKDRLREITASIETGIKEVFASDNYRQYLSTMSRFHRYSVNNTMLIYLQKPDATLVAGFNKWINQFERHVKKGERGITIIAPTPFKKRIEEQKLDPDTKAPVLDQNGQIVTEEKEVEIPMFRPVKVFDVSQTDGKPLPQLASDLSGNVRQYEAFMEALRRTSPVPMAIAPLADDTDGYFSLTDQRIAIREGMSEVQTVSAAVHEIAHSILHNTEKEHMTAPGGKAGELRKTKEHRTQEVEAESVSYAVCQYFGIQTGENSFGYIASWSEGKELAELKESLETINKTANSLITDIDRHFAEVCKGRGIDLSAEPEPPLDEYPMPDEGLTVADLEKVGYLEGDMLPLSKETAQALLAQDYTVYAVTKEGAQLVFDEQDLTDQPSDSLFAIGREEWQSSPYFQQKLDWRQDHQQEREQNFLSHKGDCFAIYQLGNTEEAVALRFLGMDYLQKHEISAVRKNYDLIYTVPLTVSEDRNATLDKLYEQFNLHRPDDFYGHSLSVSDIVAIRQDGAVSYHYVDSFGFAPVPDFIKPENYLKASEIATEDDYGMIDGIINNGSKQQAEAETEQPMKKKSVVEQLRSHPPQEAKKAAPKRSTEREH